MIITITMITITMITITMIIITMIITANPLIILLSIISGDLKLHFLPRCHILPELMTRRGNKTAKYCTFICI